MAGLDLVLEQRQWAYVTRRFLKLQANLALRAPEIEDGNTKVRGVVACLNLAFRAESTMSNFMLVGSWAKGTAIRPPSDVDVFFVLPTDVFHRFDARIGNKQSQLLQHLRDVVSETYRQTLIRGDGQVVVVAFNSINVEVVPAFMAEGGGFITCDTNDGGRWKLVDPPAEIAVGDRADADLRGNLRKVTRILKQWKRHCNVPIKSFHIEQLVRETLETISWGRCDEFWFDWIVRDVFLHMAGRAGGGFWMPGGFAEWISLGNEWQSRAVTASERACTACDYERDT